MSTKLLALSDAAELVPDGTVLGIGGVMDQMVPVAFLLELAARPARDLHCVTVAAGLSIDLMVAARCAAAVSCAIVSFEDLGTAKAFRRAEEAKEISFYEHSELTMVTRLTAGLNGLPYMPTRAALGTDIALGMPDALRVVECPFTGDPVLACAALRPDVSVVHVHRADEAGNAQLDRKHIWHDMVIARAARRVIVTAEEIVSTNEIRTRPESTLLPAFTVDAVVHAPRGAAPTACGDRYSADRNAFEDWVAAADDAAAIGDLISLWTRERCEVGVR